MAAEALNLFSAEEVSKFMLSELSWSTPKKGTHQLYVFSSRINNELKRLQLRHFPHLGAIETCSENARIGKKIKRVLDSQWIEILSSTYYLVQLWAPLSIGNKTYLITADQPFGLNKLHKQLCSYRRDSIDRSLQVNNYEDGFLSPPARVFRNGSPEITLDVTDYLTEEYPLRDRAIEYGIEIYIALPLFKSYSKDCIGVLEIVSAPIRGNFFFQDSMSKLDIGLKCEDLRISSHTYTDMYMITTGDAPIKEIQKVMDEATKKHKLPIAQTWIARAESRFVKKECGSSGRSGELDEKFIYDNYICPIQNAGLVVKTAFSYRNSCFCWDVSRLSINDYPFVTNARNLDLSACFAICLKTNLSPDLIYVLELFLPSDRLQEGDPRAFLDAILLTIKEKFQTFKAASGEEIGEKLMVEVIKASPYDIGLDNSFENGDSPSSSSSFADLQERIQNSTGEQKESPSKVLMRDGVVAENTMLVPPQTQKVDLVAKQLRSGGPLYGEDEIGSVVQSNSPSSQNEELSLGLHLLVRSGNELNSPFSGHRRSLENKQHIEYDAASACSVTNYPPIKHTPISPTTSQSDHGSDFTALKDFKRILRRDKF